MLPQALLNLSDKRDKTGTHTTKGASLVYAMELVYKDGLPSYDIMDYYDIYSKEFVLSNTQYVCLGNTTEDPFLVNLMVEKEFFKNGFNEQNNASVSNSYEISNLNLIETSNGKLQKALSVLSRSKLPYLVIQYENSSDNLPSNIYFVYRGVIGGYTSNIGSKTLLTYSDITITGSKVNGKSNVYERYVLEGLVRPAEPVQPIPPQLEGKIRQLFTFAETSDTEIIDESGNENNGIWGTNGVVPPLVDDSFGNTERAYDYSLTNQYKVINTQTENVSIAEGAMLWIGSMSGFETQTIIIDRANFQNGNTHLYNNNGTWSVVMQSTTFGTDTINSDAVTNIGQNDIVVWRWGATYFELWVNGVKQTTTHGGQILDVNTNPIIVNGYALSSKSGSECINQEFCIFDQELTEDDIALIQSNGSIRQDRG
jgi:hypothetical protein